MTIARLRFRFDADLGRPKAKLLDLRGSQPQAGQSKRADGAVQVVELHAGVDQRGQRHVAADSAAAIEISHFDHNHTPY